MSKIIGFTFSAIVIACLAIVALPVAVALGLVLLVLACIGAGSGLAVIAVCLICVTVVGALLLHLMFHLLVPVLVVCGIVYLYKHLNVKTA